MLGLSHLKIIFPIPSPLVIIQLAVSRLISPRLSTFSPFSILAAALAVNLSFMLVSLQCSAVQCSAVQYNAVQCSAAQCSAAQCSAVQCSAV